MESVGTDAEMCHNLEVVGLKVGAWGQGAAMTDPSVCLKRLLDMGWQRSTLAFFDAMPRDEVVGLLPGIADEWGDDEHAWLLREAKRQKVKLDIEDHTFLQHQRLLFRDQSYIDRKIEGTPYGEAHAGLTLAKVRKALPRVSWKTRADKMLGSGPSDELRQQVEEKERDRWIKKLVLLLEVSGLVDTVERKPERYKYFASRYAMGRRASTLRQHIRYGSQLQEYMEGVFGERWLRHEGDLIAYISLRMEEPCGRSVPGPLFRAVAFLELSAEVPEGQRISASALQHFL